MGTKNNPGKYDYYAKAEPDEPMFVLLARDPNAPAAVRYWADCQTGTDDKTKEAYACADAMEAWSRPDARAERETRERIRKLETAIRALKAALEK